MRPTDNSGTETQQKMPMFRASAVTLLLTPHREEVCGANTQGAYLLCRESRLQPAVLEAGGTPCHASQDRGPFTPASMGAPHEPMSRPKSRGILIGQMTRSSSIFKMTRTTSQITVCCPPLKIGHAFERIKLAAVWPSRWRQGGLRSSSRQPRKPAAAVMKPSGSTGQAPPEASLKQV